MKRPSSLSLTRQGVVSETVKALRELAPYYVSRNPRENLHTFQKYIFERGFPCVGNASRSDAKTDLRLSGGKAKRDEFSGISAAADGDDNVLLPLQHVCHW